MNSQADCPVLRVSMEPYDERHDSPWAIDVGLTPQLHSFVSTMVAECTRLKLIECATPWTANAVGGVAPHLRLRLQQSEEGDFHVCFDGSNEQGQRIRSDRMIELRELRGPSRAIAKDPLLVPYLEKMHPRLIAAA